MMNSWMYWSDAGGRELGVMERAVCDEELSVMESY